LTCDHLIKFFILKKNSKKKIFKKKKKRKERKKKKKKDLATPLGTTKGWLGHPMEPRGWPKPQSNEIA
jgi:hypothetical protein